MAHQYARTFKEQAVQLLLTQQKIKFVMELMKKKVQNKEIDEQTKENDNTKTLGFDETHRPHSPSSEYH